MSSQQCTKTLSGVGAEVDSPADSDRSCAIKEEICPLLLQEWKLLPDGLTKLKKAYEMSRVLAKEEVTSEFSFLGGQKFWDMIFAEDESSQSTSDCKGTTQSQHQHKIDKMGVNTRTPREPKSRKTTISGGIGITLVTGRDSQSNGGVLRCDTMKGFTLECFSCQNFNGDGIFTHIESCGCILCPACIIHSALNLRCEVPGQTAPLIPCTVRKGWYWDMNSGQIITELCGGIINREELQLTISPNLFQQIFEIGNGKIKREELPKLFECPTRGCPGYAKLTDRRKIFRCPICNQLSILHFNFENTATVEEICDAEFERTSRKRKAKDRN